MLAQEILTWFARSFFFVHERVGSRHETNASICLLTLQAHISSGHAELAGLSNLCPFSSSWTRERGSTPGYGVLPPLKISQQVTPNDHCMVKEQHLDCTVFKSLIEVALSNCTLTTSVLSEKTPSCRLSGAIHLTGSFTADPFPCRK